MKKIKGKKSQKKKMTVSSGKRERILVMCIAVLGVLAIAVAAYGIWSMAGTDLRIGGQKEDPLMIKELYAGDYQAEICEEDGQYVIRLAVDETFEFQKVVLNLLLPDGASISSETNCLLGEMAGRPVVHLGIENPVLVIQNGEDKREYLFQLELRWM